MMVGIRSSRTGIMKRFSAPTRMRQFSVFHFRRPWPLWMKGVQEERLPVNLAAWLAASLTVAMAGIVCVYFGFGSTTSGQR